MLLPHLKGRAKAQPDPPAVLPRPRPRKALGSAMQRPDMPCRTRLAEGNPTSARLAHNAS